MMCADNIISEINRESIRQLPASPVSLNPFPNQPWFLSVCSTSLLKTLWEKEKLLVTSNFSFSRSVFYAFGEQLTSIFIKFKISRLQTLSVWKSLKFVVWERVNSHRKVYDQRKFFFCCECKARSARTYFLLHTFRLYVSDVRH